MADVPGTYSEEGSAFWVAEDMSSRVVREVHLSVPSKLYYYLHTHGAHMALNVLTALGLPVTIGKAGKGVWPVISLSGCMCMRTMV